MPQDHTAMKDRARIPTTQAEPRLPPSQEIRGWESGLPRAQPRKSGSGWRPLRQGACEVGRGLGLTLSDILRLYKGCQREGTIHWVLGGGRGEMQSVWWAPQTLGSV